MVLQDESEGRIRTKGDSRIFLSHVVTLLVGKEHVR